MTTKLTPDHLRRRAAVYIRQSSMTQVHENLESQRRQYGLADVAKELGFRDIEVIDDDLGRSGSGVMARPGFQRLVAAVCTGEVGAVFCVEASRLARNGRDWHHLIDLCALTGVVVVDPDGTYDPRMVNDRLLLGLKGTMSEFELTLLKQRSMEAIRAKAKRGELRFCLPVGLCWTTENRIERDPDARVQEGIRLVFGKLDELGSVRQVLLWFRHERVELPTVEYGKFGRETVWKLPIYNTILRIVKNPLYAGAYAFGMRESRTTVVAGRAHRTEGHAKPRDRWSVLLHDHHDGYITWERYERNQRVIEENAHMKNLMGRKAARGGRALLGGMLRCGRCGRMLHVTYSGPGGVVPRYQCRGANINHGTEKCISFGGQRIDEGVGRELLRAVEGDAIDAAVRAAEQARQHEESLRRALELELEEARYEARLAARRYEAVDPDRRLVAAELEARWETALERAREIESRLRSIADATPSAAPDREVLLALARDLPAVWEANSTSMAVKQRITRILLVEIVADVDAGSSEVVLKMHWAGGRHSELRVRKNRAGEHGRRTDHSAIDVVRQLAGSWPDDHIASILNRLGLRTGAGNNWKEQSVRTVRSRLALPAFHPSHVEAAWLTLGQAAKRLGVSQTVVRRLVVAHTLPATQVLPCAPWQIAISALELEAVQAAVMAAKAGRPVPRTANDDRQLSMISTS